VKAVDLKCIPIIRLNAVKQMYQYLNFEFTLFFSGPTMPASPGIPGSISLTTISVRAFGGFCAS
jgi:hypothetical protein